MSAISQKIRLSHVERLALVAAWRVRDVGQNMRGFFSGTGLIRGCCIIGVGASRLARSGQGHRGALVMEVSWAIGKSPIPLAFLLFLASWAETGTRFRVGWDTVYRVVAWAWSTTKSIARGRVSPRWESMKSSASKGNDT